MLIFVLDGVSDGILDFLDSGFNGCIFEIIVVFIDDYILLLWIEGCVWGMGRCYLIFWFKCILLFML